MFFCTVEYSVCLCSLLSLLFLITVLYYSFVPQQYPVAGGRAPPTVLRVAQSGLAGQG